MVLVTGASGFVGKHLTSKLSSLGVVFRTVSHREELSNTTQVHAVVHLAGMAHRNEAKVNYSEFKKANVDYAVGVAKQAFSLGMRRFVYVSTIGVYGQRSSSSVITENSNVAPKDAYSKSKLLAETELRKLSSELGFELVIVRPALVYGVDAPGNIARVLRMVYTLPILPIGVSDNRRSFVAVENLVDFLILCLESPEAGGGLYNISDGEPVSTKELLLAIATGMNRKRFIFSFPRVFWRYFLGLIGRSQLYEQLFCDLVVDNTFAKTKLCWTPPISSALALKEMGRKYRFPS
ncbi:MAG: NAD-dependent epimerase/dehydratase family protein [Idiomarina sp.]|nr:NAD-dependent epimerase/dehydratase family protein [Idiomarina sp.]